MTWQIDEAEVAREVEEEQEMLRRQGASLRSEQRRNERNAESVTNEMFAECQVGGGPEPEPEPEPEPGFGFGFGFGCRRRGSEMIFF